MKISFVNWPINNVGGIVTTNVGLIKGLRQLGHDVEVIHVNQGHRLKIPAEDGPFMMTGRYMSIRTDALLKQLMDHLNSVDLVVFAHPSPHPTKAQKGKAGGGVRWKLVYEQLKTRRVVYFHDNLWYKTNAWFADVQEHVTHILCDQKMFTESAAMYPGKRIIDWAYFPIIVDDVPLNAAEREKTLITHTQWVRWKRHREFLKYLPESPYRNELYNEGIEYCYLRKEELFSDYVTDRARDHVVLGGPVEFFGTVPHSVIRKRLREVAGSVDFSKRGYVNCTHWEPLAAGGASFTHQDVLDQQNCCLPDGALVIPFTDDTFVEAQHQLLDMDPKEYKDRQLFGWNFVRNEMSPVATANTLLRLIEDKTKDDWPRATRMMKVDPPQ